MRAMPDDPVNKTGDGPRPLAPGDTNASRHPHNDGRGTRHRPDVANQGRDDAGGRDKPPEDERRRKRSPDSPWMGGG
jgi:hypothetical protein